jgi:hypothetical protein
MEDEDISVAGVDQGGDAVGVFDGDVAADRGRGVCTVDGDTADPRVGRQRSRGRRGEVVVQGFDDAKERTVSGGRSRRKGRGRDGQEIGGEKEAGVSDAGADHRVLRYGEEDGENGGDIRMRLFPSKRGKQGREGGDFTAVDRGNAVGVHGDERVRVGSRCADDTRGCSRRKGSEVEGLRTGERKGGEGRIEERGDYFARSKV